MRNGLSARLVLGVCGLVVASGVEGQEGAQGRALAPTPDYARAERFLTWNTAPLVHRDAVRPVWLDGARFWYRVETPEGREFMRVDAATGSQAAVFDNARLASAMSLATDTSFQPHRLPIDNIDFTDGGQAITFRARGREFRCTLGEITCTARDTVPGLPASHMRSPDGRWDAFIHEYDLWVRPPSGGDSVRLTMDGERKFAYGLTEPRANAQRRPQPRRPVLQWSPDSRRIAVQRTDERNVGEIMLFSSTSQRPQHWIFPYAQPGDSVIPVYDIHIVDVAARTSVRVDAPAQSYQVNGLTGIAQDSSWVTVQWAPDAGRLYFTHALRGPKRVQLMAADAATGATRVLAKDSAGTFIELNQDNSEPPNWRVTATGDVIWFSERDGWAHLWLFDDAGNLRNRITSGAWAVATIQHVDEAGRWIYFTGRGREAGRDPYLRHLYRVRFDGTGLQLLTPEDADHQISFSPDGRWFVDTFSKVDVPPMTVLRAADGGLVRTLEEADASALAAMGWRPGEPFTVKARDGVTDIHGVLWKPTHFDPSRRYPIIDHIYPGPQIIAAPKRFFPTSEPGLMYATFGQVQALAELGFIVVHIDAMGTPHRSKAYLDTWYGDMGDNGIPDHVVAIQQLAARHSWIDIDRVGIYGHSGGGFASTGAILRYPDFFKVAVSTAGNHDNRTYQYHWGEKYQGLLERDTVKSSDNFESQANYLLAENLKGKLFLLHGDLDDNVLPSSTTRLVDALIRANKTFDLLMLPDMDHGVTQDPYVIRRSWDYFVEHLLGARPPENYPLKGPPEG
jgi:dipeptidyl-peptidase 4